MIAKDDELTAEELAYLNSGGQTEVPAPVVQEEQQPEVQQETVSAQPNTETPSPDTEEDDGDALPNGIRIITDDQGRQRLVNAEGKFVRSVPHAALHKERERRKATEGELQKMREAQARLDERLAILNEALKPKPVEKEKTPLEEDDINPNEDPLGALSQLQRRNQFLMEERKQSAQETKAQTEARTAFEGVQRTYREDAARVLAANPAFKDAYTFLMKGRDAEYAALGMTDPAQRAAAIARDEAQIVIDCVKGGRSPAETIFAIAKARGFTSTAAAAPNGQMKPTASATQATAKLQQLKAGQTAAQTLSGTGGSPHEGLTPESLANMSQADFDAMVEKLSPAQQRQLLGG
jgi:hypothetical protein